MGNGFNNVENGFNFQLSFALTSRFKNFESKCLLHITELVDEVQSALLVNDNHFCNNS